MVESAELPTMYELCLMHARADRALRLVVAKQLETMSLTLMEWLALAAIATGPKEGLSMSQVAKTLDVTLPQVTALVSSLTKSKLCKQKILASDRRGRQVMATLKGRRVLARLEDTISKAMRSWTKDIPREQLANYLETVKQLAQMTTE